MPGDVVLARDSAVLFIPPQFAQRIVETSEVVRLRDMFGHERLREGRYKDAVTHKGEMIVDGHIPLSNKPGIGVDINIEATRRYAANGVPFFE